MEAAEVAAAAPVAPVVPVVAFADASADANVDALSVDDVLDEVENSPDWIWAMVLWICEIRVITSVTLMTAPPHGR